MEYTVKTMQGCKVVFGDVPMSDFSALLKTIPKNAIIDIQVAEHLGATLVAGMPGDTRKLLSHPPCEAIQKQVAEALQQGLSQQAANWLLHGERGSSSKTIFTVLTGFVIGDGNSHPHDPDDLRRCRLLLEQVPELAPRIGEMAKVSKQWTALAEQWAVICRTMDEESPDWRNCKGKTPKTYALMQDCCR